MNENFVDTAVRRPGVYLARLNRVRDRWRDHSLTLLLVVQIVMVFGLVPASAEGLPFPPGLGALVLLLLMSVTIVMAHGRWTLAVGAGTFLMAAVASAFRENYTVASEIARGLVEITTIAVLSVVVAVAVFRPGRFTGHRVRGAVVLYLNLGLGFAFLHRLVAELVPGSYTSIPPPQAEAAFRAALNYFSFATLTSVGYGDIVPVRPFARSLCMLEATLGQLLPTLLIGRVVMLAMREGPDDEAS